LRARRREKDISRPFLLTSLSRLHVHEPPRLLVDLFEMHILPARVFEASHSAHSNSYCKLSWLGLQPDSWTPLVKTAIHVLEKRLRHRGRAFPSAQ
jgi:hypothetical protein